MAFGSTGAQLSRKLIPQCSRSVPWMKRPDYWQEGTDIQVRSGDRYWELVLSNTRGTIRDILERWNMMKMQRYSTGKL